MQYAIIWRLNEDDKVILRHLERAQRGDVMHRVERSTRSRIMNKEEHERFPIFYLGKSSIEGHEAQPEYPELVLLLTLGARRDPSMHSVHIKTQHPQKQVSSLESGAGP